MMVGPWFDTMSAAQEPEARDTGEARRKARPLLLTAVRLTGHIAGHHLSAVCLMWAATGDARFKERADTIVAELAEVQAARGDGYLSALEGGREAFAALASGEIRSGGFGLNGEWSPCYTLHTSDARQTIDRILNLFDAAEERLILQELSLQLRAVISQRLVRAAQGRGRLPVCEIPINTPIVSKKIAEGEVGDIAQAIANGDEGMRSFMQSLARLVKKERVTEAEALKYVEDENQFRRVLKGHTSQGDVGGGIVGGGGGY